MNAVIIVARLESERLPQKHLQIVEGLPLIKWLTERIKFHFRKQIAEGLKIIIASPATLLNKKFEDVYKDDIVETFRGDENNVPWRVMECSNEFNLNTVVIADGDNFLLSMEAIETVLENLATGILVAKTEGLPLGMNVIGWHASHLKSTLNENKFQLLETGWSRIFKSKEIKRLPFEFTLFPQFDMLRFTTDYPEDLQFMQKMFQSLGDRVLSASSNEIIKTAVDSKFFELNGFLSKIYFDNFYKKMDEEKVINHEENI
ncbi:MAG TPA: hypothetical protein VH396_12530 [Chitinophagaceae bacterium]|jgi:spore coat polysaccharide biosynthesis protein SpsF (cytidylyltransferase family)